MDCDCDVVVALVCRTTQCVEFVDQMYCEYRGDINSYNSFMKDLKTVSSLSVFRNWDRMHGLEAAQGLLSFHRN